LSLTECPGQQSRLAVTGKRLIGVIVEKVTPASPGEAGWAVKGVKYGNADRSQCAAALSIHLNQLQREFRIED
jgi:hypothetical protein